jgi:hypothetical protein
VSKDDAVDAVMYAFFEEHGGPIPHVGKVKRRR